MTTDKLTKMDSFDSGFSMDSSFRDRKTSFFKKPFPHFSSRSVRFFEKEESSFWKSKNSQHEMNTTSKLDRLKAIDFAKILLVVPFPISPILILVIWYILNYRDDRPEWLQDFLKVLRMPVWREVPQDEAIWFENFGKSSLKATYNNLLKQVPAKKKSLLFICWT